MLKSITNPIFTVMLITGLMGCNLLNESKPSVEVEAVSLILKEGVELESVSSSPTAFSINESEPALTNSSVRTQPERFYMVQNKSILDALKSKLGTNYLAMEEKYQSAMENGGDLFRYPELGVEYKFKPQVEGVDVDDHVCFKLYEAFQGLGVLISVRGTNVQLWSGNPLLYRKNSEKEQELVVDLFDSKIGVPVFRIGKESFFGFQKSPGGSVFLLVLENEKFKLARSVSTLPMVNGAAMVYPDRMNAYLSKIIGPPTVSDGFLVYFADERNDVIKIFHMDRNYVFKDVSTSCTKLSQNELLPVSMSCKIQSARL